jgi:uncharacterized damage-inducible protein DinB
MALKSCGGWEPHATGGKMGTMLEPMLEEFREEALITKRILERVPGDKLAWKPHAKSMSLGQLAWHIATVPGGVARLAQLERFDRSQGKFDVPHPKSVEEILAAFEESVGEAEGCLQAMSDQQAQTRWRLMRNDTELLNLSRVGLVRRIMLNHWYHHRGQLSVYLRILDVPIPVIYGRSADEDPFA